MILYFPFPPVKTLMIQGGVVIALSFSSWANGSSEIPMESDQKSALKRTFSSRDLRQPLRGKGNPTLVGELSGKKSEEIEEKEEKGPRNKKQKTDKKESVKESFKLFDQKREEINAKNAAKHAQKERSLSIMTTVSSAPLTEVSNQHVTNQEVNPFWIPYGFIKKLKITKEEAEKPLREIYAELQKLTQPNAWRESFDQRKKTVHEALQKMFSGEIIWFPKAFVEPFQILGIQNLVLLNFPGHETPEYMGSFEIHHNLSEQDITGQKIEDVITIRFMKPGEENPRARESYAINHPSQTKRQDKWKEKKLSHFNNNG